MWVGGKGGSRELHPRYYRYYYSIGWAKRPLSVCDVDHAACEPMRMDAVPFRGAGTRRVLISNGAYLILCRDPCVTIKQAVQPTFIQPPCPVDLQVRGGKNPGFIHLVSERQHDVCSGLLNIFMERHTFTGGCFLRCGCC